MRRSTGSAPTGAVLSPDGRWVVYSTRTGAGSDLRNAVMVQPFPATGALFQISKSGEVAHHPVWSWKGTEVLYNPGQGGPVIAVPLTLSPTYAPGEPVTLPRRFVDLSPLLSRPFDQMPDGRMLSWTPDPRPDVSAPAPGAPAATTPNEIRIVLNWIEELKAKVR